MIKYLPDGKVDRSGWSGENRRRIDSDGLTIVLPDELADALDARIVERDVLITLFEQWRQEIVQGIDRVSRTLADK